jgi:integrase
MSEERLFKRANGRVWYGWFYEEGKRRQLSTRCTDRRAAEAVVRGWEREASDPAHAATAKASLGDALALVLDRADSLARTGRRSTATASFYRAKAGHLARIFEPETPFPLRQMSASHVDRYLDQRREEDASEHTLSKELGVLRLALKLARRVGIWTGDPAAVLPVLHDAEYTPRTRWLTLEELTRLLGQLVPDRAARVAFLVATGARWSESESALRLDVGERSVTLRGTKTALSARAVPVVLPEQSELLTFALRHAEGTEKLFAAWGNVRRDLVAACERAKIQPCSPNDLRRTFAHWLRAAGAAADLVAPSMGHVDTRMVQRVYGRLGGDELRAALERAVGCSAGAADSAAASDSAHSAHSKSLQNAALSVPRDGIEPPTRGFSILPSVARLWPNPRKNELSTAERRLRAAPVQQSKRAKGVR